MCSTTSARICATLEERFRVTLTVSADATVTGQTSYVIDRGEQVHTAEAARALAQAAAQIAVPAIEEEPEAQDVDAEEPVEEAEAAGETAGEAPEQVEREGERSPPSPAWPRARTRRRAARRTASRSRTRPLPSTRSRMKTTTRANPSKKARIPQAARRARPTRPA